MAKYIAVLDGKDGAWGARLPDFPGCHGAGDTAEKAVTDLTRALREFAADMVADGEEIPAPRDLGEIKAEVEAEGEAAAFVYVPLLLDRGRPVRANLSLDAGTLEAIDAAASERGVTRSAFLVSAALEKIVEGR